MTPGALLLLLAVAASQVGFLSAAVFANYGEMELTSCDIAYYGKQYTWMDVTLDNTDFSAKVCFKNSMGEVSQDCLLVNDTRFANSIDVTLNEVFTNTSSAIHDALAGFYSPSYCYLEITFRHTSNLDIFRFRVYDFSQQAALAMKAFNDASSTYFDITAKVGMSTMESWTFTDIELLGTQYFDISACRYFDQILDPSTSIEHPDNCTQTVCDVSADFTLSRYRCQPWEDCDGNNMCVPKRAVCTVTGSTVINFANQLYYVPDRCVYTLVWPSGMSSCRIFAGFRERRLQDMPFLDYLILMTSSSTVYLYQGGRVEGSGQELNLTTPLLYGDILLSKDETGVYASLPFFELTVHFDGNTAHLAGLIGDSEGLCGHPNVTGFTDEEALLNETISFSFSEDGCRRQHVDSFDGTSHCTQASQRCSQLWVAPFDACLEYIYPEPYVDACISTSCNYPDVDGITCQFLEAYVKSCHLLDNITVEDWRASVGCSVILQDSCLDQRCSDHEFCGENLGETRCLCRALFAAEYEPDGLGEPTECATDNSVSVTLAACLLWAKGIDYSVLHLNDPNCVGDVDEETHMVTFSFNDSNTCEREIVTMGNKLIYMNTIQTMNTTMEITHYAQVEIDFSCAYMDIASNQINNVGLRISNSSVVQEIISGIWNYTLIMSIYTDPTLSQLVEPYTEIQLNQKLWMFLQTEGLDSNMIAIVTRSCWATSTPSSNAYPRHYLITDGCPNPDDDTVETTGNGMGTSNSFSFNMFMFYGGGNQLYLHCLVELCPTQSQTCTPNCSGFGARKRRSISNRYADENPSLITMTWTD